ncbi:expressed unknown protein [Seminavis robusta]|uniref:Uncharacterized protein n=1 Tax=Seminavis robusta TaxID=568900 RepID=A0A9N8E468_9STRA|nr:expressed unknown protein [Seminavis robusta]|eukprot:Sro646_g180700.1 n/a (111) ;mRNA; r:15021-15353
MRRPQEEMSLHDVLGDQASTWLEESRAHFEEENNSSNQNGNFSPLRIATYMCLAVLFILWGRRHYLRHQRRRQAPAESEEQVEEVIFVLGIPLLIHRRGQPSSRQAEDGA